MTEKQKVIQEFKITPSDTGSVAVQVALLTKRIKELTLHFKVHKKDFHSMRGLMQIVSRRKQFLARMKKNNLSAYQSIVKSLSLRK